MSSNRNMQILMTKQNMVSKYMLNKYIIGRENMSDVEKNIYY